MLGSSFWSFSSRVLSGTPKSFFSTIETYFKSVPLLIQVSGILPALQTKIAHFLSSGEKKEQVIGQMYTTDVRVIVGLDSRRK